MLGIAALVLVTVGLVVWGIFESDGAAVSFDSSKTTYFWGDGCPHCEKVNDFLEENKVAEKFSFEKLEVWKDRGNARLMQDAAGICKLDSKNVGVPFVFSEGKCLIGEPDVTGFFKEKAGL